MRLFPFDLPPVMGIIRIALIISLGAAGGCLSRPTLDKQTFTFGVPANSLTKVAKNDHVLGIRILQVAPPFEERSLVYRTGELSYQRDPYAEFLDVPAEGLKAPVRDWLRAGGNFSAVLESGSALRPNELVEISVSQLFGDFRTPGRPAAVLAVRFLFFDAPNGVPGVIIFQREYSRHIPLESATATALMAGWNQALAEIFTEMAIDFQDPETGGPGS